MATLVTDTCWPADPTAVLTRDVQFILADPTYLIYIYICVRSIPTRGPYHPIYIYIYIYKQKIHMKGC